MLCATGGCAMFGHSCYGGHGKRSFQAPMQQEQREQQQQREVQPSPPRDWPATSEEETQIDDAIDKYFQLKPSSPHYTPFWQKWVSEWRRFRKILREINNDARNPP